MSEWQPIITAPKDGRWFLACAPGDKWPTIAHWWTSRYGYSGFGNGTCYGGYFSDNLAYWMPSPEPPTDIPRTPTGNVRERGTRPSKKTKS